MIKLCGLALSREPQYCPDKTAIIPRIGYAFYENRRIWPINLCFEFVDFSDTIEVPKTW